jgi:arginase
VVNRPIAVLGAPSSIGIKLYDDGTVRRLYQAPGALRAQGLIKRLGARDLGDVQPPPYREMVRPPGRARNEAEVERYSRDLAAAVAGAARDGAFIVLLGGDCSILLGALLGLTQGRDHIGLVYLDGHADFATPEESRTGSVASMDLALAVGRGDSPLARLSAAGPLVRGSDVVLAGRRDQAEAWYGHHALGDSGILDLPGPALEEPEAADTVRRILERMGGEDLRGFWIHLDADVIDPSVMPAVDSPEPGGPSLEEMARLLGPLVRHPRALGLELTIYDPGLDADGRCAERLVQLLETVLT